MLNVDLKIPLCVDLDCTLVKTDTFYESVVGAVKSNPALIFVLPFYLAGGITGIKNKIFDKYPPDPEYLPYNETVINLIEKEREAGRKIFLVTASLQKTADSVAAHVGNFDGAFGSCGNYNLKGKNKAGFLEKKFGNNGFIYVGDSKADLWVWEKSAGAVCVNTSRKTDRKTSSKILLKFGESHRAIPQIIKQIRIYQWVKNLLIFIPLLLAHNLEPVTYAKAFLAFLSFSFAASAVYVLNDMSDLKSDRAHKRKRNRPFASGRLHLKYGFMIFPAFLLISLGAAFSFIGADFGFILAGYLVITTLYSFYLKKFYLVDIITLAGLYTIRILAGGEAAEVYVSNWLMGFSLFLFLSLATMKRYTELIALENENREKADGRGYRTGDKLLLLAFGPAAGLLSILVFNLYINSPEVIRLYEKPLLLYMVSPLLILWILRLWLKSHRGEMHDDPIVFTMKDKISYIIFTLVALLSIGATL